MRITIRSREECSRGGLRPSSWHGIRSPVRDPGCNEAAAEYGMVIASKGYERSKLEKKLAGVTESATAEAAEWWGQRSPYCFIHEPSQAIPIPCSSACMGCGQRLSLPNHKGPMWHTCINLFPTL